MLHSRVVKTQGQSRSFQVYAYRNGKRVIIRHIGSGTTAALQQVADRFIADYTGQSSLFEPPKSEQTSVLLSQCT
ncbi:hypothetical protein [Rhodoflexus sp.]